MRRCQRTFERWPTRATTFSRTIRDTTWACEISSPTVFVAIRRRFGLASSETQTGDAGGGVEIDVGALVIGVAFAVGGLLYASTGRIQLTINVFALAAVAIYVHGRVGN
jgi:hypothetical protein